METDSEISKAKSHLPKLILNRHAHKVVHGDNPIGLFNTWVAVKVTKFVGSMWCAYVFSFIALISLPFAIRSGDPIVIVGWIAQTFLQLVLLPIIIVGQNVQGAADDARAESDHETLVAIHTLISEVHRINEQQNVILDVLEKRTHNLKPLH